jgi:hypothetical protein
MFDNLPSCPRLARTFTTGVLEAKHKAGHDSGVRVRNAGLELVVERDEVVVQVVSLAAQPEMITQAEVQAAANGPRERRGLLEKGVASTLGVEIDVSTPDQELPEGPDPGRPWKRNRDFRSEQEGGGCRVVPRTANRIRVMIPGEICFEADPFVGIYIRARIPAILSIPKPREIGRRVRIASEDFNP